MVGFFVSRAVCGADSRAAAMVARWARASCRPRMAWRVDPTRGARRRMDVSATLTAVLIVFYVYVQAPVAAQKIRIRLRSFETNHMQSACDKIIAAAAATEARISGPVPLPTKRRIYCVLRSPHVNKDSREHFETRTHHRLIDVHQPTAQTIDALMALELPSGVDVEIKL